MARRTCDILGSIEEEKRRKSRPKGRLRWISFERPRLPLTPNCEKRKEKREREIEIGIDRESKGER